MPRVLLAAVFQNLQRHAKADSSAALLDLWHPLTTREVQIVEQIYVESVTNKEIARQLSIMEDTVKKHLQSVFAKLGNRASYH